MLDGSISLVHRITRGQVRARLQQKLLSRKKSFAFNFQVDDNVENSAGKGDERTEFRFGFDPAEEAEASSKTRVTPASKIARNSGGSIASSSKLNKSARSGLAGGDEWISTTPIAPSSTAKTKNTRKGSSMRRTGASKSEVKTKRDRKNAEPASGDRVDSAAPDCAPAKNAKWERPSAARSTGVHQPQEAKIPPELAPNNDCSNRTSSQNPINHGPPQFKAPNGPAHIAATSDQWSALVHPFPSLLKSSRNRRPPPGLTLESWKDPALTEEERRRRRFGRGVRNMAAIQRSWDARRGDSGVPTDADAVDRLHLESEVGGEPDRSNGVEGDGGVGGGNTAVSGGGSSVFAFGFDIGISFNGS